MRFVGSQIPPELLRPPNLLIRHYLSANLTQIYSPPSWITSPHSQDHDHYYRGGYRNGFGCATIRTQVVPTG